MTSEPGAESFLVPEPGTESFRPELHCGLEFPEQRFYDHAVLGALDEVDQSFELMDNTINKI